MNRRGFTLLETLIVLAIMGIVMGSGYALLRPMLDRNRLENATTQVATDLMRVRSYAQRSNHIACWMRLDDRRYRLNLGGTIHDYSLPEGLVFTSPSVGAVIRYRPPYGELNASAKTVAVQDAKGRTRTLHIVGVTGKVIYP